MTKHFESSLIHLWVFGGCSICQSCQTAEPKETKKRPERSKQHWIENCHIQFGTIACRDTLARRRFRERRRLLRTAILNLERDGKAFPKRRRIWELPYLERLLAVIAVLWQSALCLSVLQGLDWTANQNEAPPSPCAPRDVGSHIRSPDKCRV